MPSFFYADNHVFIFLVQIIPDSCVTINTFPAGVRICHTLESRIELLISRHLELHKSPVDCARELFKPSKDLVWIVTNRRKWSQGRRFVTSWPWSHGVLYNCFWSEEAICCYCFPQMLIFTEAQEKLGKELQGEQELTSWTTN